MDRDYWTKELREAERELDAATRLSDVEAAAKRLQRARAELKALEAFKPPKRGVLAVVRARRALPHDDLLGFIDLETRLLEVLDYPIS